MRIIAREIITMNSVIKAIVYGFCGALSVFMVASVSSRAFGAFFSCGCGESVFTLENMMDCSLLANVKEVELV